MARARTNKLYRTFVKGLITEAGYLTYPEDASSSELNTVLSRKGNRTRRRGIRYEEDYNLNPVDLHGGNAAINEYVWHSVAQRMGKTMTVVQVGSKIHFWSMDEMPLSDHKKNFVIDLLPHKAATASQLDVITNPVHFASGAGYLFIAHKHIEPLCVEYFPATDTFSVFRVVIQIRDFEGVYDGLANDEEPRTLTKEHHYNLLNQGWVAPGTKPAPALGAGETPPTTSPTTGQPSTGGGSTYYDPYTGTEQPYTPGGGVGGIDRFNRAVSYQ